MIPRGMRLPAADKDLGTRLREASTANTVIHAIQVAPSDPEYVTGMEADK